MFRFVSKHNIAMITTVAVTSLLTALTQKGLDKAFETGGEKISEGAIGWIKSLFFKDGKPKKIIQDFNKNQEDENTINNAKAIIENSVEDDVEFKIYLKELLEKLPKTENNISNSKNIVSGNVNTVGGDFINGDNNQIL